MKIHLPKMTRPECNGHRGNVLGKKEGLMKAGKCFYCEEHGHMAKDCQKKKEKPKEEPPKYEESMKK